MSKVQKITKSLAFFLSWPIQKFILFLIITIRPLLGPANCRFPVTCGKFAIKQLQTEPLHLALWRIIKRLLSCSNPFWRKTSSLSFLLLLKHFLP